MVSSCGGATDEPRLPFTCARWRNRRAADRFGAAATAKSNAIQIAAYREFGAMGTKAHIESRRNMAMKALVLSTAPNSLLTTRRDQAGH
jgi:hypothetical protein